MKLAAAVLAAAAALLPARAAAQSPAIPETGAGMYRAWCAVCHGENGDGRVPSKTIKTDPGDFTKCRATTGEPDADWRYVIVHGGQAAGLSADMPAFPSLSPAQVDLVLSHTRSFCREPGWPSGNLNVRRALIAPKAFPDDEIVIAPVISHGHGTYRRLAIEGEFEMRLGRRAAVSVAVPFETVGTVLGTVTGAGDAAFGAKYVLTSSASRMTIATAGLTVTAPTATSGRQWGFGEGTVVLEPYVAFGAVWRGLEWQGAVGALFFTNPVQDEFYPRFSYHVSVSRPLSDAPGAWSVGVELDGRDGAVGLTPQVRVALTPNGAWSATAGVRLPLRPPYPDKFDVYRWMGAVVWDYRARSRQR